ncbi:MAG: demethylmenaquinone methyltransferase/2-methoxy-6-polyprenyl-1,4-benzoquinol methylase [Gammaproteobacteria bacterium]|jgi:demethylmenaquinone methyltransferase/2-methoxy-6-polyprenyl-1,4-benzoquinol methylase
MTDTTHFGFKEVPVDAKASEVRKVFDAVADKYDVMNDLMSLGIHRIWKQYTVDMAAVRPGDQVLDVAAGTGDLSYAFSKRVGDKGHVWMTDINEAMLARGKERMIDRGVVGNIDYRQANAEELPFDDNQFDLVTIAFGLRNVTDKDKALRDMYRVLKPGGRLLVLEFSKPTAPGLGPIYDQYSFKLLPMMGQLVANDPDSYRYLAESIRMHPNQETLKGMMDDAGFFRTQYFNLTGGIVALHRGYKL